MSDRKLLELQETDLAMERLVARRAHVESGEDLREPRSVRMESETRIGDLRLELDEVSREQMRLENEIESMRMKAAAEQKRLYDGSVANAKELEAIQHEITSIDERRGRTEDELLTRMERREELESDIAEAERLLAESSEIIRSVGESGGKELDEIAAELARLGAVRKETAAAVTDDELLDLYEDLRKTKHGVGAAALVDGVCQGCHQKLSALEVDRLHKTEGIKRCDYCRRILIFA